jgi:sugar phosphate permease
LLFVPVICLGLVVFCAFLSENGLQAWSALHLEGILRASPEIGALGPAMLGLAFAIGRFGGQTLQHRLGLGRLVGFGALLAAVATATFASTENVPLALAAIFVAGLGISVVGPSALGSVGQFVSSERRGRAVAAVNTIAYIGFFAGPALLGFVSNTYGLRAALGVIAGFCLMLVPIWVWLLAQRSREAAPTSQ